MSSQICDNELLNHQDSKNDIMGKPIEVSPKKKGGLPEMRSDELFGSGAFGDFSSGNPKLFSTNINIGHLAYN